MMPADDGAGMIRQARRPFICHVWPPQPGRGASGGGGGRADTPARSRPVPTAGRPVQVGAAVVASRLLDQSEQPTALQARTSYA